MLGGADGEQWPIGSRRRVRSTTDSNATVVFEEVRDGASGWSEGDKRGSFGSKAGSRDTSGTQGSQGRGRRRAVPTFTVVTCNGGGVGKIKEFLTESEVGDGRRADIVLAQEHHVGADDLDECLRWGRRAGWKVMATPATGTQAGGTQRGLWWRPSRE